MKDLAEQSTSVKTKINNFLSQFYTDLLLVERLSQNTAETYKISIEIFLNWCSAERIKLSDITIQNLMYYLIWRKTNNCSSLTISKEISALRSFGSFLQRQNIWTENLSLLLDRWFQDVRFLDGSRFANQVDLFVGGSPCQSFSTYGKKGGLNDARGTLFYEYARLVQQIQPTVFIYENVRGLKIHKGGKTWEKMQEIFHSLDYDISEAILNAVDYGLPQMRKRMFVVGIRRNEAHDAFVFPKKQKLKKKVLDYLDEEVSDEYYLPIKGFKWVTETDRNDNKARVNRDIMGCQTAVQQVNWSGDFRIEPAKPSHINSSTIHTQEWGNFENAVARKLTPKECFRLMGFENFIIDVPDRIAYRQAGNSIAVPVIKAILKSVFKAVPSLAEKARRKA